MLPIARVRSMAATLIAILGAGSPAEALEKKAGVLPAEDLGFESSSTVTVAYYNLCTGAVWNWIGAPPLATYGVRYDDPTPRNDVLLRTHMFFSEGAPAGYGYTSLAFVTSPFEPRCPGFGSEALQFFLPQQGWNTIEWNGDTGIPVEEFWVMTQHSGATNNPTVIVTERGADDAPGGRPGGCGTCFSPSRETHSWFFGSSPEIVCPGGPWFDASTCWLELLWMCEFRAQPLGIEEVTWGRLKSLYR